jgi:multisubunit Na+/H+ antiporter MnhC subunit
MRLSLATPSEKLRLPLALALLGLILTSVALAGAHLVARPMLQSAVERDLTLAARQLAGKLDQGMFERWQDITLGARRQVLRDRAGDASERELVHEVKARHSRYAWVGFTDENCIVRVSTETSLDGMNVEARPWCVEARKGPFVGDIHDAVLLKSRLKDIGQIGLLMDIAVPVRSPANTVTGVLAAHLMADWLMDANEPVKGMEPIETAIITSHGQVVLGTGLMDKALESPALAEVKAGVREGRWPDGEFVSVAVATNGSGDFPGYGWTAVARMPQAQANALPQRIVLWTLVGGITTTLLMLAVGLLIARRRSSISAAARPCRA